MPHLILEHSKELKLKKSLPELIEELHFTFAKQETIRLGSVKSRTIISENCILGDKSKPDFVFLQVKLLSGRPDYLKQKFVEVLANILENHLFLDKCSFCIEITELQYYFSK